MDRASASDPNQCSFRHSSRNLPLKLSTYAFCVGLPASISRSSMPRSYAHWSRARPVNSGPWSVRQGLRQRSKPRDRVQDARDVLAGDAVFDHDVDGLLAEVVDDRQALEPPAVFERVADEVHRPDLVRPIGLRQRPTLNRDTLTPPAPLHL